MGNMDRFLCTLSTILLVSEFPKTNGLELQWANFSDVYTGVVFSPYSKLGDPNGDKYYPVWNVINYPLEEVQTMMDIVQEKFAEVATYGAGATGQTWDTGDGIAFTAYSAAEINHRNGFTVMRVYQGIWININVKTGLIEMDKERAHAFEIAKLSNEKHPGTVTGLIFGSGTVVSEDTAAIMRNVSGHNMEEAHKNKLQFGTRVSLGVCRQVLQVRPEVAQGLFTSDMDVKMDEHFLSTLMNFLDFIICYEVPAIEMAENGPEAAAQELGRQMLNVINIFKKAKTNGDITVILETGWPSQGISNTVPKGKTTVRNMMIYWNTMNELAQEHKFKVHFQEAIDQPWKAVRGLTESDPGGINGGNSHLGRWYRTTNNDSSSDAYNEKEPEPAIESEGLPSTFSPLWIILVVGIVLPIIAFLVWRLHTTSQLAKTAIDLLTENEIRQFENGLADPNEWERQDPVLCMPYDRSFELDRELLIIDEDKILGQGQFGTVFKGTMEGMTEPVAVKSPKRNATGSYLKSLLSEIKLMIYIGAHENIVSLIGAYTADVREGKIYIVSEFCAMGSLEGHLRSIPRDSIVFPGNDNPNYTTVVEEINVTNSVETTTQATSDSMFSSSGNMQSEVNSYSHTNELNYVETMGEDGNVENKTYVNTSIRNTVTSTVEGTNYSKVQVNSDPRYANDIVPQY